MTDYTSLITYPHNNKPEFVALVDLLCNGVGAIVEVAESLETIFDLDTAVGAQLDATGEWIGQSRVASSVLPIPYFGFNVEGGSFADAQPFGNLTNPAAGGPFYSIGDATTVSSALPDVAYRPILQAKAIKNQYNGTMAQLEQAIEVLTGSDEFTIIDPGNGTCIIIPGATSIYSTPPALLIQELIETFDILPRPQNTIYVPLFPIAPAAMTWALKGTCTYSQNAIFKATGTAQWDSCAYYNGALSEFFLSFSLPVGGPPQLYFVGFASAIPSSLNPATQFGMTVGDGFYVQRGSFQLVESNTVEGTIYDTTFGDIAAIACDGENVYLIYNGVILATIAYGGGDVYPVISMYQTPNGFCDGIVLGTPAL